MPRLGAAEFDALRQAAGIAADTPLAVASGPQGFVSGHWPNGAPVAPDDRFYGASLSKQLTGAAIALLVKRGQLDPDTLLRQLLPLFPAWADAVTVRHLLHHTGGLPEAGLLEATVTPWTNDTVFAALRQLPAHDPGTYRYSNAGYICLAAIIETVTGSAFDRFVNDHLFTPLKLTGFHIQPAGVLAAGPQVSGMGRLPFSTGDGGLWTTAASFATWLEAQNRDALGIASLVERPAEPAGDYGWGIGIRSFRGHPLFIHGGSWTGAAAKAVRCPALGLSVVALSAGGSVEQVSRLVDLVLDRLADQSSNSSAVR